MEPADLLRRLRALFPGEDNTGFHALDLIHKFGSPLTPLLYAELFWPELVEIQGMVFLATVVEDEDDHARVMNALSHHGGDRNRVEQAFNCIEVPSLFGGRAEESNHEEDLLLARKLAAMWRARLADCYPDRVFEVSVDVPADELDEVAVRFYQVGS